MVLAVMATIWRMRRDGQGKVYFDMKELVALTAPTANKA